MLKRYHILFSLLLLSYGDLARAQFNGDITVLNWLNGRWLAQQAEMQIEEIWSLQGQSLMAISRSLMQGRSQQLELLVLEPAEPGWQFRLRFFGPASEQARRGKDEPLRLQLISADKQHFLAEGIATESGTQLSYRLLDGQSIAAELIKRRDGKILLHQRYHFKKVGIDD